MLPVLCSYARMGQYSGGAGLNPISRPRSPSIPCRPGTQTAHFQFMKVRGVGTPFPLLAQIAEYWITRTFGWRSP